MDNLYVGWTQLKKICPRSGGIYPRVVDMSHRVELNDPRFKG